MLQTEVCFCQSDLIRCRCGGRKHVPVKFKGRFFAVTHYCFLLCVQGCSLGIFLIFAKAYIRNYERTRNNYKRAAFSKIINQQCYQPHRLDKHTHFSLMKNFHLKPLSLYPGFWFVKTNTCFA